MIDTPVLGLLAMIERALPVTHFWEPRLHGPGCNYPGCEMPWEEHGVVPRPGWDEMVAARAALAELRERLAVTS